MNYVTVESSQIESVGYDADSETLGIRFKATGKSPASEYHYANVSPRMHRALMCAPSIGSYFTAEIKKKPEQFPYTCMGETLPPTPEEVAPSALAKIDTMTPAEIFVPGTMDPILFAIKEEVDRQAAKLDISTPANRKALNALAFKVTKSKTYIEQQRKSLVAAEKKRLAAIDAEGKRIWDILEGIAAEVRRPLTEWEQIDKERIARHERLIASLQERSKVPFGADSLTIKSLIARVEAVDPSTGEEFASLIEMHKATALKELKSALAFAEEMERQKAENARLQTEAAERATQERAIAAARLAREQAEKDAEAERFRLQEEARLAEKRALEAEQRAAEAVETERRRAQAQKEQEAAEAAKREANKKHRAKIHAEAATAIAQIGDGAEAIVEAIAAGKIPHVTITY